MSGNAIGVQGTLVQRGDGATPEVFTTIPEIISFGGLGGQSDETEVTDINSTAKEFRLGLPDSGEFTFTINFIPTNVVHRALLANHKARTLHNYKITWSDGSITTFSARVKGFERSAEADGVVTADVTFRISGEVIDL
jgi:hypothetical protein